MGQARDEAGNVWETDAQGNAVRLLAPATGPSPASGIGVDPYKASENNRQNNAETRADRQAQLAEDKAAREAKEWAAKFNSDGTPKAAAMTPAQLDAKNNADTKMKAARSLTRQLGRMREIYDRSFKGSGLKSIKEWLPTSDGQRFKAVAESMRADLKPLIRGPGEGTFTEGDQKLLDGLIPQPESWDARNEERFNEIENRIKETEAQFGPPKQSSVAPVDQMEVATGDTRTEVLRGPVEKKLAAMLSDPSASGAAIKKYARDNNYDPGKLNGALAYRALNPTYKGGYDVGSERTVPVSAMNRAMASPAATVGLQAANAFTAGTIDEIAGGVQSFLTGAPLDETIANADMQKQMQARQNPGSALAGNILGGATALMTGGGLLSRGLASGAKGGLGRNLAAWGHKNPIKAGIGGDMAYGTAYGVGEQNDARLSGAAIGAGAGLVGSAIGSGAVNVGGRIMRGVVNPAAQRLQARGIPITAGEVLGGGWKKLQDAGTSVWGPGNLMSRRYGEGREAFNRAAFNEAGDVIGTPINRVGQPAIDALSTAKSGAYGNALDPVTLDLTDPQFATDVTALGNIIGKIPPNNPARAEAFDTLTHRIKNNMDPNGQMSGRNFQESYRGLARSPKERTAKDYQTEFAETMQGGKQALADTLERQNPGAYDGFLKANSANRHLSILTDAVNAAKNQLDEGQPQFTPAQLGTAATGNTNKFIGKEASASGNRPFNQLINDAQQIMSQKIGDSGTAGRAMFGGAMLGAGGVGYGADGGTGATVGALSPLVIASMLNTKVGQTALTKLLLERIAPFKKGGQALINNAPVGGAFGTAYAVPAFAGQ